MVRNVPTIIAIDDNNDNLVTIKAFVTDAFPGVRVFTALNGKKGIELAREYDPDVILLDIVMPGTDGFEICRQLKQDQKLRHIPVVFLTSLKGDRASRIRALEVGGEAFITKPFDEIELTAQIRAMMKIKEANDRQLQEKEHLGDLVVDRTIQLERELAERKKAEQELEQVNRSLEQNKTAMLNLLEDLNEEIDVRKKSELALKESEENYRSLFECMIEGFAYCQMIYDTDGLPEDFVYLSVNPAFNRIMGTTTVIGKRITEIFPGIRETIPEIFEIYGRVARTGNPEVFDLDFKAIGKWLHHSVSSPAKEHFIAVFEDITERKLAEKELELKTAQMALAQNMAKIGYWSFDIAAGMPAWSDMMFEVFGRDPSKGVSHYTRHHDFIHPDDWELFDSAVQAAGNGTPYNIVIRVIFPDNSIHFISTQGYPQYDKEGKITSLFGTSQDITARKTMETQREDLIRELEQKNTELERFNYTVSHDLKSPLITIKWFAGLLEDDVQKCDTVRMKADAHRITDAAGTMEALLADLLELSRVGRIVKPPEMIGFDTIAREAADILAVPLNEREVTVEIAPDLPVVNVDHARIREAMVNLIENAIKFTGKRPDPVITIGADNTGETPVFFVKDNGIGIDPRYLDRIFNLFERLDVSTHGTGIGLVIVRRIIEVHGGKIWAESEGPGKGTTFRFTLPGPGEEGQ